MLPTAPPNHLGWTSEQEAGIGRRQGGGNAPGHSGSGTGTFLHAAGGTGRRRLGDDGSLTVTERISSIRGSVEPGEILVRGHPADVAGTVSLGEDGVSPSLEPVRFPPVGSLSSGSWMQSTKWASPPRLRPDPPGRTHCQTGDGRAQHVDGSAHRRHHRPGVVDRRSGTEPARPRALGHGGHEPGPG